MLAIIIIGSVYLLIGTGCVLEDLKYNYNPIWQVILIGIFWLPILLVNIGRNLIW